MKFKYLIWIFSLLLILFNNAYNVFAQTEPVKLP